MFVSAEGDTNVADTVIYIHTELLLNNLYRELYILYSGRKLYQLSYNESVVTVIKQICISRFFTNSKLEHENVNVSF